MVTPREKIRVEFESGEFMNYLYAKGANFERWLKSLMEEYGWFCVRSAGSRGAADLVCTKPDESITLWINCKDGEHQESKEKIERLIEICGRWNSKIPVFAKKSKGVLTMTNLRTGEIMHTARNPRLKNQGEEKDQWGPV